MQTKVFFVSEATSINFQAKKNVMMILSSLPDCNWFGSMTVQMWLGPSRAM